MWNEFILPSAFFLSSAPLWQTQLPTRKSELMTCKSKLQVCKRELQICRRKRQIPVNSDVKCTPGFCRSADAKNMFAKAFCRLSEPNFWTSNSNYLSVTGDTRFSEPNRNPADMRNRLSKVFYRSSEAKNRLAKPDCQPADANFLSAIAPYLFAKVFCRTAEAIFRLKVRFKRKAETGIHVSRVRC